MECDICRTLEQQLRSYEMEVEEARNAASRHDAAGVTPESLLNDALEQSRKTSVLYQHHREGFHKSVRLSTVLRSGPGEDVLGSGKLKPEQLIYAAPLWPDDLSALNDQAILNFMTENRAWNKRLREETAALVKTRLAKTITKEEYASKRNHTQKDAEECYRRSVMLIRDLAVRERRPLPFSDSGYLAN
jgi:hypothetical protein